MSNPFDDGDAMFYVLINQEGEHSLWPIFAAVPGGWSIAYGAANRNACLRYVQTHWVDMRADSLPGSVSGEAN
ncbi:MbtH family protein [Streptomyces gardneri]|jgi:MbtH protein|uniref:MbtH family protein n=1 Tax=Nocardia TaxID=1817 RepID=UPI0013583F0E|nr:MULTISPECIES: MbtH family protein [Nocardia]MBF6165502.1 MbtH family protein [Streptomyces gardneri]MBF6206061.1 MbtH family protein [Streptomyces gardneri]UAK34562.1 MbtH family protein [Nocardia asteroides]